MALDEADPWCCVDVRAACLVELKKSTELFAFAHTLVDAYPNAWTSWFAVGCYYYLIGEFLEVFAALELYRAVNTNGCLLCGHPRRLSLTIWGNTTNH